MLLCFAVRQCAASPTGDRLYITSWYPQHKLLTLARDGTLLATYTDPALLDGLHVTPAGQLLVGYETGIIQLHREGNRKLATLHTNWERYSNYLRSVSVCYNSTTSSILVGGEPNCILVLKVQ